MHKIVNVYDKEYVNFKDEKTQRNGLILSKLIYVKYIPPPLGPVLMRPLSVSSQGDVKQQ